MGPRILDKCEAFSLNAIFILTHVCENYYKYWNRTTVEHHSDQITHPTKQLGVRTEKLLFALVLITVC